MNPAWRWQHGGGGAKIAASTMAGKAYEIDAKLCQPANQPTNQPPNPAANQPTNQPTSQPANRPTSQPNCPEGGGFHCREASS